jgi:hypothetical protein
VADIKFGSVSVADRGTCVSAIWPDCAVDTTLAEHIIADLEKWLSQLAGHGNA